MSEQKPIHFFMYGTLKVGGHYAGQFDKERKSSEKASIKGRMYHLGGFPGVKLNEDGTVHGEVHTYDNVQAVQAVFNRIEGYSPKADPKHCLYLLKTVKAKLANGEEVDVQVYEFNRSTEGYKIMEDGTWPIK